jgi:hypothetical protein
MALPPLRQPCCASQFTEEKRLELHPRAKPVNLYLFLNKDKQGVRP